jgi:aldehyde dehydrogenase (NAD+)
VGAAAAELFERQRQARWRVAARSPRERRERLQRLLDLLLARRFEAHAALAADYRKVPAEVDLAELYPLAAELRLAIRRLERWARPSRVPAPLVFLGSRAWVRPEPKGQVLILSPWNYPLYLSLGPLVSAVAAGNCAVLKPSEYTPGASAFLKELLAQVFPEEEAAVLEGDAAAARDLLALPFDHVFFTGSPAVGREVMAAASRHLASVTLELGGKSPVLVDADVDPAMAARRIAWGKFLNAGQTCVAPDYVLAHRAVLEPLVRELGRAVARFYGPDPERIRTSPHFGRIVHGRHLERLRRLLETTQGQVRWGGQWDAADNYFAPTLVTGVGPDDALMGEEIFGPILPVLEVPDLEAAARFVNARPKPLALYCFTGRPGAAGRFLASTTAGGTCVNDTVLHFVHPGLPAGGVNHSGLGKAHGHQGFLEFSNLRAFLRSPRCYSPARWLHPPYGGTAKRVLEAMLRWL